MTNVSYNAADQMSSINHNGIAETRQYNALYQLTRITVAGQMDLEYRYSASANNGQITQMKNWITGEEVNYSYDAVGRLSAATTGTEWGLSFTYDGFGNKTAQTVTKGTAPAMSVGVDGNNRVVGWRYDAAGFPTAVSGQYSSIGWDAQGRMQGISVQGGTVDTFVYDAGNRRVWRNNQLHLRGVDGRVVALLNFNTSTETFSLATTFAWFAGRKVGQKVDGLGTVQNGSRFYPYGEESASTGNDTEKFATYWRDSNSGLDYAVNRYYKANTGRFMSPDPYRWSAGVYGSGSWNRYAYVEGDPVNANDPSGLDDEDVDEGPRGSFIYSASGMFGSASNASSYIYDSEDCAEPPCPVEVQLPRGQSQRPQSPVDTLVPGAESSGLGYGPLESCDILTRILQECGDAGDGYIRGAALLLRRANPALFAAVGSVQAYVQIMKTAGEKAVQNATGLVKNVSEPIYINGVKRIPDFIDTQGRMIHEAKNTFSLNWTAQIRDMAQWANSQPEKWGFTIWYRQGVIPSQTMRANAATHNIILREMIP